ncbi:hypothetical protein [Kitasatospora sp. MBT63]|uniref:hypothetical protein n=1 Tax=Kitasatospora sp. MBT63 TaxID=1444768 RepID=UPI00053A0C25|nr:hypothetical protein [Kitasatospora sp. MBT63]
MEPGHAGPPPGTPEHDAPAARPPLPPPETAAETAADGPTGRFAAFLSWWARMRMADWTDDGYL